MKKFIVFILIINLIAFCIFGATQVQTKRLSIQGGIDTTLFVNVVPLAAQTQSYIMGMPFSVDDALVAYDYGLEGRQIATWSILTNVPFTVSVNAGPLTHTTDQKYRLPYYLCFEYSLSYYGIDAANPSSINSIFVIKSTDNNDTVEEMPDAYSKYGTYKEIIHTNNEKITLIPSADYSSHLVGSLDGMIYFKFAQNTMSQSSRGDGLLDSALGGDYVAQVTVTVEADV